MKNNAILLVFISFMFFTAKSQIIEDFVSAKLVTTYATGSFTGNQNIIWNFVNARGGQTTTTNKNAAISLNKAANACIFSDTLALGISFLQFQYEQELSANCNAKVYINDSCIGEITTTAEADVTKIFSASNIYFTQPVVIKIVQSGASSGQLTIDDITYSFARKPEIPFVLQKIEHEKYSTDVFYSNQIGDAQVISKPTGAITNYTITNSQIHIEYTKTACGDFTISVLHVQDTSNKICSDTIFQKSFYPMPQLHSLVISEIMVDPTPTVGLPDYEYIELYNSSNCAINLEDVYFIIGDSKLQLPYHIIKPNSYAFIISKSAKNELTDTLKACFVPTFPSLLNQGQSIQLLNTSNQIISHVQYSDMWYANNFKKEGGWSLEKIDVSNVSETNANWKVAQNYTGGTPGFVNSVQGITIDNESPKINEIKILSPNLLHITYNENVPLTEVTKHLIFSKNLVSISVQNYCNSMQTFEIKLSADLEKGEMYNAILTSDFVDFANNSAEYHEFAFARADSLLQAGTIVINEILCNPISSKSDFIELYNSSNSYFMCSNLFLANIDSVSKDFTNITKLTDDALLCKPQQYIVISANAENYKNESLCADSALFITLSSMPSMPDNEGTIVLLNQWGKVIDSVYYNENWHAKILKNREGVSLERVYSSAKISNNWYSSSTLQGGNSAGCKNLQQATASKKTLEFRSEVISPNNDGEQDFLELVLDIDQTECVLQMSIYTLQGEFVKQIANNQLLGTNNFVIWDATNEYNSVVESGIYVVFIELFKNEKLVLRDKKTCTVIRK